MKSKFLFWFSCSFHVCHYSNELKVNIITQKLYWTLVSNLNLKLKVSNLNTNNKRFLRLMVICKISKLYHLGKAYNLYTEVVAEGS